MRILWSTAKVPRSNCIVHADLNNHAYVHRPLKWICKQSTGNLLNRMMWNLEWEYFKIRRMLSDLLALCMLVFVHTCTDPQKEFANKVLLINSTESKNLEHLWRKDVKSGTILLWSNAKVFRSTCIVQADLHSRAYVHRPHKWICKQNTANTLDGKMWNLVW